MEPATIAELQVLLEGVSLPVGRSKLLRYAAREGADPTQLGLLGRLPDRSYDNIDAVAEELLPVQPAYAREEPPSPREESGAPPGGEAYTQPHPESGQVGDLDAVSGG